MFICMAHCIALLKSLARNRLIFSSSVHTCPQRHELLVSVHCQLEGCEGLHNQHVKASLVYCKLRARAWVP